jgi:hypothetical protein
MTVMSRTRFTFADPEIHDRRLPFSHAGELHLFHDSDIGLMPLPDGPYERAKENYKTKIYLASGLPVVASPVEMNRTFIVHGQRWLLAATDEGRVDGIRAFAHSQSMREEHAKAGRAFIVHKCGIPVIGKTLLGLFKSVSGKPALRSQADALDY